MRSARLSPACTAAVLRITSSAAAQYQVFDGGFTSRVHGWTIWETVAAWSPNDAGDSPFSGSARIVNTWPTGHNAMGIDQCLAGPPIVPGKSYDFGGMIYLWTWSMISAVCSSVEPEGNVTWAYITP